MRIFERKFAAFSLPAVLAGQRYLAGAWRVGSGAAIGWSPLSAKRDGSTPRRQSRSWAFVLIAAGLLTACETIPYNKKAAEIVEMYGDAADRHIVAMAAAWKICKATNPPTSPESCKDGAFSSHENGFYDDWESKLFSAQQQAASGDVLGICEKAGELASSYTAKVTDSALKSSLQKLDFSEGKSCSLGSVGGVLQQHRNLRGFHENFVVIDRDEAMTLRETIAQSVRIALTVENFKKSAADADSQ